MKAGKGNVVSEALRGSWPAWLHVAVFSTCVNVLMLTGSIYMLQVYDRVLSSRSIATLLGLSAIALAAFALQGALDAARHRILGRIGALFDARLAPLVMRATVVMPLRGAKPAEVQQPLRDLDSVRAFLSSMGPTALIDMPFMPLFIAGCFILHPYLGWLAVAGAALILSVTLMTERFTKTPTVDTNRSSGARNVLAEAARRNAEAVTALGMGRTFDTRLGEAHARYVSDNLKLADAASGIGSFARVLRLIIQSAVLGLGAYLVIRNELSAGAMIAASVLTSRALAPLEIAIANWKGFVAARQGYARLGDTLQHLDTPAKTLSLPPPRSSLAVQDLAVAAPGTQRPLVMGVSFDMKAGQGIGLIGPSGSGKSTLARALVGVWPAMRGSVRLDGALLEQWDSAALGASIGYLPQDVELFEGTIAENIARFTPGFRSEDVLKAAEQAGAHDLIVSFPNGYDTLIGEGGAALSGGQRQRIALARALYGDPFLLILDEPNASLDSEGDEALTRAIRAVRGRGGIAVIITHRPSGLAGVDLVGAMNGGKLHAFGPRDEVLQQVMRRGGMPTIRRPVAPQRPAPTPAGAPVAVFPAGHAAASEPKAG